MQEPLAQCPELLSLLYVSSTILRALAQLQRWWQREADMAAGQSSEHKVQLGAGALVLVHLHDGLRLRRVQAILVAYDQPAEQAAAEPAVQVQLEGGSTVDIDHVCRLELHQLSRSVLRDVCCEAEWRVARGHAQPPTRHAVMHTAHRLSQHLKCYAHILAVQQYSRPWQGGTHDLEPLHVRLPPPSEALPILTLRIVCKDLHSPCSAELVQLVQAWPAYASDTPAAAIAFWESRLAPVAHAGASGRGGEPTSAPMSQQQAPGHAAPVKAGGNGEGVRRNMNMSRTRNRSRGRSRSRDRRRGSSMSMSRERGEQTWWRKAQRRDISRDRFTSSDRRMASDGHAGKWCDQDMSRSWDRNRDRLKPPTCSRATTPHQEGGHAAGSERAHMSGVGSHHKQQSASEAHMLGAGTARPGGSYVLSGPQQDKWRDRDGNQPRTSQAAIVFSKPLPPSPQLTGWQHEKQKQDPQLPDVWIQQLPPARVPTAMNVPVPGSPDVHRILTRLASVGGFRRLPAIRDLVSCLVCPRDTDHGKLAASIMIFLANHWRGSLGPCTADQAACYDAAQRFARIPPPVLQRLTAAPDWLPALMGEFSGGLVTCSPSL